MDAAITNGENVMGKLIIVRHGESEANRDKVFATSGEVPLTEAGRAQALHSAAQIAKRFLPKRIISSTFLRARQTADIIAKELDLAVEVYADIHERNLGSLKGQPYDRQFELAQQDAEYDPERKWLWRPPGGESYEDVRKRVLPAFDRLRSIYPKEETVVVSHGAVMFSLWSHFTDSWKHARTVPNCGIMLIEHDSAGFSRPQMVDECAENSSET
jgi:broad specificity phosphatase PhoE